MFSRGIFRILFLLCSMVVSMGIQAYTPGKASPASTCSLSASGTTGACYVYFNRPISDPDSQDPTAPTSYLTLRRIDKFFINTPGNQEHSECDQGTTCFYLEGFDNASSPPWIQGKCNGGYYMMSTPATGATGPAAARYAMLYGAMMSDRLVVLTVDSGCNVTGVRLVETPVRDFK